LEAVSAVAQGYVLDPAWERERDRLEALGSIYNANTFRHARDMGIAPGWRVLELGAGTGTTAMWFAEQVAPGGRVLATDLDLRFLEPLAHECLEARRHDVVREPLEEAAYDLIHARLLLEHLPERYELLGRLVSALRPGGWLFIEDFDLFSWGIFDPPSRAQVACAEAIFKLFDAAGFDREFARRLPRLFREAGLVDVETAGFLRVGLTGEPQLEALPLMLEQLGPRLVDLGFVDQATLEEAIAESRTDDGRTGYSPLMVSCWGRRP
jgi:SAM-dependent methyltransferase